MGCKDELVVALPWHCIERISQSPSAWHRAELTEIVPFDQCVVVFISLFLVRIETNMS
jgi:hypothetical protein